MMMLTVIRRKIQIKLKALTLTSYSAVRVTIRMNLLIMEIRVTTLITISSQRCQNKSANP